MLPLADCRGHAIAASRRWSALVMVLVSMVDGFIEVRRAKCDSPIVQYAAPSNMHPRGKSLTPSLLCHISKQAIVQLQGAKQAWLTEFGT
jgi:hypothetical protein